MANCKVKPGCGWSKKRKKWVRVCKVHAKLGRKVQAKPAAEYRDQTAYHKKYVSAKYRSQAANRKRARASKAKAAKAA